MNNIGSNKEFVALAACGGTLSVLAFFVCLFFSRICAVLCLAVGVTLTVLFCLFTAKRLKALNELNSYLTLVCSGKYELRPDDNTEGEISILENNIYKVVTLLKTKNEQLLKDKTFLANSLADISHQLKTPLTSMTVMTDIIKDNDDLDSQRQFISIIEAQLEKMNWLIRNLLKLSKLDAGTIEFEKKDFSMKAALENALAPFLVTLDLKNIGVEFFGEDFSFCGDMRWSEEAFGNIIKNCIEHTESGGRLEFTLSKTSIYSDVKIKDTGCGIEEEDIEHIFERFYHGKNSSSDSVGIGLALSKAIFEKQRASIAVKSEKGKGSEFEVRFYNAIV